MALCAGQFESAGRFTGSVMDAGGGVATTLWIFAAAAAALAAAAVVVDEPHATART